MRNRTITVIPWTKKEDEILHLHCETHRSNRMIRLEDNSLRCSFCGSPFVATKTVMTFNNPSLVKSQPSLKNFDKNFDKRSE